MSSPTTTTKPRRIIRRNNSHRNPSTPSSSSSNNNNLPPHLTNNQSLHHVISNTLPADYTFEILKTIHRIESLDARHVALQLPEGLLMYATCIGDILRKFSYANLPSSAANSSSAVNAGGGKNSDSTGGELTVSILGDVTYGACCIDDLTAVSLDVDLLVHYGHSCLVPTTRTALPCLYVFVEIRVDAGHLVDCVRLTFEGGEAADHDGKVKPMKKVVECAVMGTVQFRSAVVEAAQRLNRLNQNSTLDQDEESANTINNSIKEQPSVEYRAIVPQAKPLSPGEVLGCTAPSGLASLNWGEAMMSPKEKRELAKKNTNHELNCNQDDAINDTAISSTIIERVMIFLADGRFHLEAAMISNPTLRALRYDPYSKTLTEEKYEIIKMKRLRRESVRKVRDLLGVGNYVNNCSLVRESYSVQHVSNDAAALPRNSEEIANSILDSYQGDDSATTHSSPSLQNTTAISPTQPRRTMGIILGTLGRQGNPGILGRIRSLLQKQGVRTMIVLLSEIFPKKLEMMSMKGENGKEGGVCAWVQIACPRLSIDWGHYFCVPVLSPFELFVALGEVADSSLWSANDDSRERNESEGIKNRVEQDGYPMDFYSKAGGPWTNYFDSNKDRRIVAYGD